MISSPRRLGGVLAALVILAVVAVGAYRLGDRRSGDRRAASRAASTTSSNSTSTPTPFPSATECGDGDQSQLNDCAGQELAAAEATLGTVLADVLSHAGFRRGALEESQQQWLVYREVFCQAHALEDGSIQELNVLSCKAALTTQRSRDVCEWILPNSGLDAVVNPPETCRQFRS